MEENGIEDGRLYFETRESWTVKNFEGKNCGLVHADDLVRARVNRVEVRKYFLIDVFYFLAADGWHASAFESLFWFFKSEIRRFFQFRP